MQRPTIIKIEITMYSKAITDEVQELLDTLVASKVSYAGFKVRFQVIYAQFSRKRAENLLKEYLKRKVQDKTIKAFKILAPGAKTTHFHQQIKYKWQDKSKRGRKK